MSREDDINWVIKEGREIADILRSCDNLEEFKKMSKKWQKFTSFCNEKFGEPSDGQMEGKYCYLNTNLGVATAWKTDVLNPKNKNNKDVQRLFLEFLGDFEKALESKHWAEGEGAASGD